jgi:outer membrane cobalamin receptor
MKPLLIFLVLINVLYAQNIKPEELDNLSLEELMDIKIYSATKSYQRIEEIPAHITILTRKDIEKYNYTTLDELLKHVPGLFIIDDTEHFQIGSRGSLGSSFKLMINNNPISPLRVPRGGMSNRNFFSTPVQAIDRIEIIKGPQAVTYGSNAMYGSINIITNDFNEKNIISVSKGNNGQEKVFARINKTQENGGFTLNTGFYQTNGINGDLEDGLTQNNYNKYSNDINIIDKHLENGNKTIDFSHRYKNLTTDITYSKTNYGFYTFPIYRDGNNVEQTEKTIALTYEDDIKDKFNYKINFIVSKKDYKIDDIETENYVAYGNSNYANDKRVQLDAHLNYNITDKFKILLGSTYKNIKENAEQTSEIFKAKQSHNYEFNETDLYTKLHYKFNDKFELNSGVRYSKKNNFSINRNATNLINDSIIPTNPTAVVSKEDYLPEFSAIYHINQNNHLKFLFGKANQLTYSSIDKYEEINSSEINYMYISKKYQINSSIFFNEATNISLFTQNGTNLPTTYVGDKITKGLEFALTYKPNHNLDIFSSITLQNTKHKVTNGSENYSPDLSPKVLSKLGTTHKDGETRYSLYLNYVSKMKAPIDNTTNKRMGKDSNHNINLNANINHKFTKNSSFNLNITNILDRDNRVPASSTLTNFYNGAFTKGREFLFTFEYKF